MSAAGYRAAGVDYDALDAGKRMAMAAALVDLAAAGRARRPRARRLPRRARVRVRARRAHARVRRRGSRHEVDDRPPGARAATASTASPTSPTTRSRRSSTTSAASARCRWSSTPTSRPAPRSGTREGARARVAAGGLAAGVRRTRAARGAGASRPRCRGCVERARDRARGRGRRGGPARGARRSSASELAPGDEIVLVASSGLHANGASLARLLAERLPDGYATRAAERAHAGRGAARAVGHVCRRWCAALLRAARADHLLSHITGHGLLKLMRRPPAADLPDREAAARCRRC